MKFFRKGSIMENNAYDEFVVSYDRLEENVRRVGDQGLIDSMQSLLSDEEVMSQEKAALIVLEYIVSEFYERKLNESVNIDPEALKYFESMSEYLKKNGLNAEDAPTEDKKEPEAKTQEAEPADSTARANEGRPTVNLTEDSGRGRPDAREIAGDRQNFVRSGAFESLLTSFGNMFSTIKDGIGGDKKSLRMLDNIGYSAHRYERGLPVDKDYLTDCFKHVGRKIHEINKKEVLSDDDINFLRRADYVLDEFSKRARKSTDSNPEERSRLEEFIKMSQDLTKMLSELFVRIKSRFERLFGEDGKLNEQEPSSASRPKI